MVRHAKRLHLICNPKGKRYVEESSELRFFLNFQHVAQLPSSKKKKKRPP